MCNRGNESEDPGQELIWPREALPRRECANKALREMSPLTPRYPYMCAERLVDKGFHTHYLA